MSDPSQFLWWDGGTVIEESLVAEEGKKEGKHRKKRLWIQINLEHLVILLSQHAPSSTGLGQIAVSQGGFVMLMHPDSSASQDLEEVL